MLMASWKTQHVAPMQSGSEELETEQQVVIIVFG